MGEWDGERHRLKVIRRQLRVVWMPIRRGLSGLMLSRREAPISQSSCEVDANWMISEIEHIWQMIYRFGFYRGGPVMMSALSGVRVIHS